MSLSVDDAFARFLQDRVSLDREECARAEAAREELAARLNRLPEEIPGFPLLIPGRHLFYGSFARGTKIRPLDDIDLMVCLHGESGTFNEYRNRVEIVAGPDATRLKAYCFGGTCNVDSRKIIAAFTGALHTLPGFRQAGIRRRGEGLTLQLEPYPWRYDIVPCFYIGAGDHAHTLYLIPDGYGNWKRSNPLPDMRRMEEEDTRHEGHARPLVRIMKFWKGKAGLPTIPSHLMECLMLRYLAGARAPVSPFVDVSLPYVFEFLSRAIRENLPDPSGLKANINSLSLAERDAVSERAGKDYYKAIAARELERDRKPEAAIAVWSEVFGHRFPGVDTV